MAYEKPTDSLLKGVTGTGLGDFWGAGDGLAVGAADGVGWLGFAVGAGWLGVVDGTGEAAGLKAGASLLF